MKRIHDVICKAGVVTYIALFASPVMGLKTVIATKSAASIALPFTIASTIIHKSLRSVVGWLYMKHVHIALPSICGLICALVQLFLKGMYEMIE